MLGWQNLANALVSKTSVRKDLQVQILLPAPNFITRNFQILYIMKRKLPSISMVLLTFLAVAIILQMTFQQAEQSTFSLAAAVLVIFVLSYLLARLYRMYA
jgi:hypothetical protein